jgi:predicted transcriptional regulator
MFQVAHRTESLASVLRRVGRNGLTLIPIVENERLIGIVTLQNLMHSIAMLAETRRLRQQDQQR